MEQITWEALWVTVAEVKEIAGEEKARKFLEQVMEIAVFDDEGAWLPSRKYVPGSRDAAAADRESNRYS